MMMPKGTLAMMQLQRGVKLSAHRTEILTGSLPLLFASHKHQMGTILSCVCLQDDSLNLSERTRLLMLQEGKLLN